MTEIFFKEKSGQVKICSYAAGDTVMDVARQNGVDLEGACEGSMACSTCHVIIDAAWFEKLPSAVPEENAMLDIAPNVKRTSRLGCQIKLTEDMDGLTVKLP